MSLSKGHIRQGQTHVTQKTGKVGSAGRRGYTDTLCRSGNYFQKLNDCVRHNHKEGENVTRRRI